MICNIDFIFMDYTDLLVVRQVIIGQTHYESVYTELGGKEIVSANSLFI